MSTESTLLELLSNYSPEKIDFSRRGSGLNAVWKIIFNGSNTILKTYSARRSPVKTVLTNIDHFLTGRTSYSASARCSVEGRNLKLWHDCGYAVPAVMQVDLPGQLPVSWLCMEYVEGPVFSKWLCDSAVAQNEKDRMFSLFCEDMGKRHQKAMESSQPFLIQEHASLDHLICRNNKLVTIDLEVSFTSRNVEPLIYREICGYVRSIARIFKDKEVSHYIDLLIKAYPSRMRLSSIYKEYFSNPSLFAQLLYNADRTIISRNRSTSRYDAARMIQSALDRSR